MGSWTFYWAAGAHASQPRYSQFNYRGCKVGCGAVAWGMLFGWVSQQAHNGNAYWQSCMGIYREDGGRGDISVAPLHMDNGVRNMIKEIRNHIDTFCISGSGATFPWNMISSIKYLNGRTGTRLRTRYNSLGFSRSSCRKRARNAIRDRKTPAIIGTGWLKHYPLAYGYAWRKRTVRKCFIFCWNTTVYDRYFYVNQGWGGSGNEWVSASTWFAGEILPLT